MPVINIRLPSPSLPSYLLYFFTHYIYLALSIQSTCSMVHTAYYYGLINVTFISAAILFVGSHNAAAFLLKTSKNARMVRASPGWLSLSCTAHRKSPVYKGSTSFPGVIDLTAPFFPSWPCSIITRREVPIRRAAHGSEADKGYIRTCH